PGAPERAVVRLPWPRSAERLGAPGDPGFAVPWLEGVGCRVTVRGRVVGGGPPSWRFDLEGWADLEEEVARRWGYDKLPSTLPGASGGRLTHEQRQRRRARDVLAGLGLVEVQTEPFLAASAFDALELAPDDPRRTTLRWANPLNQQEPLLRPTRRRAAGPHAPGPAHPRSGARSGCCWASCWPAGGRPRASTSPRPRTS